MAASTLSFIPHDLDILPRYTRDPETSSVHSAAPSYVSEAPSYHSTHPEASRTANVNGNTAQTRDHGSRTPTGARTPIATQRHLAQHTVGSNIHSLAVRMMRPTPAQRFTFPDSAGFVNEAKARKAYIRELRAEAALREKGMMWGHVTGQIHSQRERKKVWEGKTGGKGWGSVMKI